MNTNTTELKDRINKFLNEYDYNKDKDRCILSIRLDFMSIINIELSAMYDSIFVVIVAKDISTGKELVMNSSFITKELFSNDNNYKSKFEYGIYNTVHSILEQVSFAGELSYHILGKENNPIVEDQLPISKKFELNKKIYKKKVSLNQLPLKCIDLLCSNDIVMIKFRTHNDTIDKDLFVYLYMSKYTSVDNFGTVEIHATRDYDDVFITLVDSNRENMIDIIKTTTNKDPNMTNMFSDKEYLDRFKYIITEDIKYILDYLNKVGNGSKKYKIYTYKKEDTK